eukprot:TRINITY_DN21413_c0_g1_i1.p1 TRINITY_DN21413_c0_g1~~TRINITY_DN21413_c0_g1_i1.p1  ORF type:complete len:263 (+),score=59.48 TRINITY_DN21413_c0_g1_i1:90-878(+)
MARLPGRLPVKLAKSFEVLLPWHPGPLGGQRAVRSGRIVLRLEGAAGFGLGDHPTTQAAAAFLEKVLPRHSSAGSASTAEAGHPCRVLDWGCGSGVLALSAALSGAAAVGVDVDAAAIASALNDVAVAETDSTKGSVIARSAKFLECPQDFVDAVAFAAQLARSDGGGPFDIIVANIPAPILVQLAPALAAAARPGALLALTGLRSGSESRACEATVVREAFGAGAAFVDFQEEALENGWLLVEATRARAGDAAPSQPLEVE